jgi:hypothetical protein
MQINKQIDEAIKDLGRRAEISGAPEQQTVQKPDMVLDSGRSYLGDFPNMGMITRETEGYPDLAEPKRVQPPGEPNIIFTGDRAEVRRILPTTPEDQRYKAPAEINPEVYVDPRLVPGSDQPPAGPAIRTPSSISIDPVSPDVQPTAEGRDASFKINALESASKLVDNDELGRTLRTPVGSAVEQLYKANKSKGNQTNKELLGYIAKEFPKVEDQKTAATALFGLSYKDELSGKLG